MDVPALRVAFHRACSQANGGDLFLWRDPARTLRTRSLARLSAVQAHEPSDDETPSTRPRENVGPARRDDCLCRHSSITSWTSMSRPPWNGPAHNLQAR